MKTGSFVLNMYSVYVFRAWCVQIFRIFLFGMLFVNTFYFFEQIFFCLILFFSRVLLLLFSLFLSVFSKPLQSFSTLPAPSQLPYASLILFGPLQLFRLRSGHIKKNGNHTKDAMKRCKIFPRITDDALLFSVCASLFIHWYECEDKQRQQLKTMINKYIWELYSNNTSFYLLCNKL